MPEVAPSRVPVVRFMQDGFRWLEHTVNVVRDDLNECVGEVAQRCTGLTLSTSFSGVGALGIALRAIEAG